SSLSPSARITPSDLSLKFFGIPSVRKTTTSPAGGYHVPGHLHNSYQFQSSEIGAILVTI
ncbi:MAG: hypothetical protein WC331_09130, partial [Candidatus Omnitrophota bacterium]